MEMPRRTAGGWHRRPDSRTPSLGWVFLSLPGSWRLPREEPPSREPGGILTPICSLILRQTLCHCIHAGKSTLSSLGQEHDVGAGGDQGESLVDESPGRRDIRGEGSQPHTCFLAGIAHAHDS